MPRNIQTLVSVGLVIIPSKTSNRVASGSPSPTTDAIRSIRQLPTEPATNATFSGFVTVVSPLLVTRASDNTGTIGRPRVLLPRPRYCSHYSTRVTVAAFTHRLGTPKP